MWHIGIFSECYTSAFISNSHGELHFDTPKFIAKSDKKIHTFLQAFSQTQIFERFILERICVFFEKNIFFFFLISF